MKMNKIEALKVLGLDGSAEFEDIKAAYRRLSARYHPDRNPAGLEMMKLINGAYQSLSDYVKGCVREEAKQEEYKGEEYSEAVNAALNAIIGLGLTIEICGSWVWVSGETKPYKEVLKENGFKWAPVKKMWHLNMSGRKSFSRGKYTMDEIRGHYGSVNVKAKSYVKIDRAS